MDFFWCDYSDYGQFFTINWKDKTLFLNRNRDDLGSEYFSLICKIVSEAVTKNQIFAKRILDCLMDENSSSFLQFLDKHILDNSLKLLINYFKENFPEIKLIVSSEKEGLLNGYLEQKDYKKIPKKMYTLFTKNLFGFQKVESFVEKANKNLIYGKNESFPDFPKNSVFWEILSEYQIRREWVEYHQTDSNITVPFVIFHNLKFIFSQKNFVNNRFCFRDLISRFIKIYDQNSDLILKKINNENNNSSNNNSNNNSNNSTQIPIPNSSTQILTPKSSISIPNSSNQIQIPNSSTQNSSTPLIIKNNLKNITFANSNSSFCKKVQLIEKTFPLLDFEIYCEIHFQEKLLLKIRDILFCEQANFIHQNLKFLKQLIERFFFEKGKEISCQVFMYFGASDCFGFFEKEKNRIFVNLGPLCFQENTNSEIISSLEVTLAHEYSHALLGNEQELSHSQSHAINTEIIIQQINFCRHQRVQQLGLALQNNSFHLI
jgi:hypothetical protein